MRKLADYTDFFFIASGDTHVQVEAIADGVAQELKSAGARIMHGEGRDDCRWVLLDCGDVVVHVFLEEAREFYDLEKLWGDAPRVEL